MILDLGQLSGMIHVTAQYSNAVLVAMLPHVSDVAKRLELPIPQPVTQEQVIASGPALYFTWKGELAGWGARIKSGYAFGFHWGYLDHFVTRNSYYALQDPDDIQYFYGTVRMNKSEAIQMARDTLKKLGIPLESVFAEQEPRVTPPVRIRDKVVPRYLVEWIDPRSHPGAQLGYASVKIEVNADAKRVEQITIRYNPSLHRPWPEFGVKPVFVNQTISVNPEYAWKLLPIVLRAVEDYSKTLGLKIPKPLTTNHVARFRVSDNGGWPDSELELTNGWRFVYRNNMVNGFYAPDNFFDSDHSPILIKDFVGKRNISEAEAIKLIRQALTKLKYPSNHVHMEFKPKVLKSTFSSIPRYEFWWNLENAEHDNLISKIEAEVDMEKDELKSLYHDDQAYFNHPPPIDVPISLPPPKETNAAPAQRAVTPTANGPKQDWRIFQPTNP